MKYFEMKEIYLLIICFATIFKPIESQYLDDFQRSLCRERWKRMDWQQMLRPCRDNIEFGKNKWADSLRTSPVYSHILNMDIRKAGEISKIAIQSRTADGREKSIGGDTWRVFITGPSQIAPFVSDLENGVYEATFMVMEPGFYKAKVYLESTLCEDLKDPPKGLLKKGIKRDGTEQSYLKGKLWKPIRGEGASFKVEVNDTLNMQEVQKKLNRWKDSCGSDYKCDLLWNGFGRWRNGTWKPFIEDLQIPGSREEELFGKECIRKNRGTILIYGDDFAKTFLEAPSNRPLFGNMFRSVNTTYNGGISERDTLPTNQEKDFSVKAELKKLQEVVKSDNMGEDSVLLLNYGLPFVERMGFKAYRRMIDLVARTLKDYKGQTVWRTTPTLQTPNKDPVKAFQNHQRTKLFNAYALSKMCSQGYPAIDIYDMTEATKLQPSDAAGFDHITFKPIEDNVKTYFETRTNKRCAREKVFRKIKSHLPTTQKATNSESGSGSGEKEIT